MEWSEANISNEDKMDEGHANVYVKYAIRFFCIDWTGYRKKFSAMPMSGFVFVYIYSYLLFVELEKQLEELVAEFQESFQVFGGPLSVFLKTQWKPRMDELMEQNDKTLDEESLQKITEIGVIME